MTTTPVVSGVNMTVKSDTDLLGRNFKTEYADSTYSMNHYNTQNQLVKSVTPGGATTLYTYDTLGRQTVQAIDMNANNIIDSADLTTSTAYGYATYSGKTVLVTTVTRSQGNDSAVVSIARQSVDGLESWSTDLAGLTTHTKLERLGNSATRQTVTNPDGTKTITNMTNGKVTSVQQVNSDDSLGNLSTYNYDEFNRVIGMIETNDQTTVNTTASTYNANGAVLTQTVNGQTTSYAYRELSVQTRRIRQPSSNWKPGGQVSWRLPP
jgi:YD repeat-containing protein